METFSALLALYAGKSPVTGEFPAQRPVTLSFGVFFDLRLNKRLSAPSRRWWIETPSRSLWRHSYVVSISDCWSEYIYDMITVPPIAYKMNEKAYGWGHEIVAVLLPGFAINW